MESKELELTPLKKFINEYGYCIANPKLYAKDYDKEIFYKHKYSLEQYDTEKQDLEKFARLVVEKQFNFDRFKYTQLHWKTSQEQVDVYNSGIGNSCKLTQDEFDFVKQMVGKYDKA